MNTQLQTIELLKLLGDDTAEAVLAHLPPAQAAELRAGLTTEDSIELDRDDRRSPARSVRAFHGLRRSA